MREILVLAASMSLACGLAVAQTAAPAGQLRPVANDWVKKPTGDDVARYYPAVALEMEVDGAATISCGVRGEGTLERCVVVSESPAGYDFGLAALRLSSTFRMPPKTSDGTPVEGGTVRIPIMFRVP